MPNLNEDFLRRIKRDMYYLGAGLDVPDADMRVSDLFCLRWTRKRRNENRCAQRRDILGDLIICEVDT